MNLRAHQDPLHVVESCVPGLFWYVPNLLTLDARIRDLSTRARLAAHIPSLLERFQVDLVALHLHRAWVTLPVDPDAREHCDQHRA